MPPVSPSDGPVAVTGAAGFIGSHIVLNLVKHGYAVRAVVRDAGRPDKTAHLVDMNRVGPGSVTLATGDLEVRGSYDEAFKGVTCVFHAAAELGSNTPDATPEKVYRLGLEATKWIMESVRKSGTVKRVVYTSSLAAVGHPAPKGSVFTEKDFASMNRKPDQWGMEAMKKDRDIAYSMSKEETEKFLYAEAKDMGIDAFSVMPCHVVGPLLCADHQKMFMWQVRIGDMLEGYGHRRMWWNLVDVRDVAEAQRLIAESTANVNGDRYNLVCKDEKGFIPQEDLQAMLQRFYPGFGIGGNRAEIEAPKGPLCFLEKCVTQLGLRPHSPEDSIKANADSLIAWGLVTLRRGEDNWQRKGRDLGIKSKWAPVPYPATANIMPTSKL